MRRGQAFVIDLALGMALLLVIGVPLGIFLMNEQHSPIQQEAVRVGGALMNPYPLDWTASSVVVPGFVVDHRVNQTLLDRTLALCGQELEGLLAVSGNVSFVVSTNTSTLATCGAVAADAEDVGVVRRYAAYNDTIATIEVLLWS